MLRINVPVGLLPALCLIAASIGAQEPPSARNLEMQEMMKRMMPGEGHRIFAKMNGKWRGTLKLWNSAMPSAPPTESTSEAETKSIFGGRYLVTEAKGTIMGMPMQRMAILGYDNLTKAYTLIFYSNVETSTNIAKGTLEADGKTLTLRGEFDEPQGKAPFKNVIRMASDDVHVFESYKILPDGTELKLVEETSRRVQ
jgi:hypothetical protein